VPLFRESSDPDGWCAAAALLSYGGSVSDKAGSASAGGRPGDLRLQVADARHALATAGSDSSPATSAMSAAQRELPEADVASVIGRRHGADRSTGAVRSRDCA